MFSGVSSTLLKCNKPARRRHSLHLFKDETIQYLKERYPGRIDIRYIEQMSESQASIVVVDRKESLVMELRDDSKTTFDEAIGLSTYCNSRAGVLSYVAISENFWKQTELYEDVKKSHEQLKMQDIV